MYTIQQFLSIISHGRQFAICPDHQHVVFYRVAGAVVNFLPHDDKNTLVILLVVSFQTVHPNIVIGDNHCIQAGLYGCFGNIAITGIPIRIMSVHM